ncbi:hypothetical protein BCR33DRAFT_799410 [Rhizoclosmatium globosum]|uniref:Uncharacterized protein n=1 Tax=Rhizoclosmatium globosum TaxID=329046 RepID=A0A1Y2A7I9_9FUNG|nr:hypothetical protein BCR33DRAFT_799406 [Rhizoclosmatium globosum]ORY18479.1 hypothetical protein BCR33DRAFT_799408 [Rhizoclosmatium globosum]ORY18491.1 hypothetical protein BCR33DRAFT_799410 [Rhizoclosmatium globosum]|eukprot:ORY18468.1 hypothetical protein BCR33DRAFT_799406 [Rhizoclosmatium globosum]
MPPRQGRLPLFSDFFPYATSASGVVPISNLEGNSPDWLQANFYPEGINAPSLAYPGINVCVLRHY